MTHSQPGRETPLTAVPGLSGALVNRLASSWITTAEQLVALAANRAGLPALGEHLGISADALEELMLAVRAVVPVERLGQLEQPVKTEYGLGALPPRAGAVGDDSLT
jgi:hypothetical protein